MDVLRWFYYHNLIYNVQKSAISNSYRRPNMFEVVHNKLNVIFGDHYGTYFKDITFRICFSKDQLSRGENEEFEKLKACA